MPACFSAGGRGTEVEGSNQNSSHSERSEESQLQSSLINLLDHSEYGY